MVIKAVVYLQGSGSRTESPKQLIRRAIESFEKEEEDKVRGLLGKGEGDHGFFKVIKIEAVQGESIEECDKELK